MVDQLEEELFHVDGGVEARTMSCLFRTVLDLRGGRRYCAFFRSVYAVGRLLSLSREFRITEVLHRRGACLRVTRGAKTSATAVDHIGHSLGCKGSKCSVIFGHMKLTRRRGKARRWRLEVGLAVGCLLSVGECDLQGVLVGSFTNYVLFWARVFVSLSFSLHFLGA